MTQPEERFRLSPPERLAAWLVTGPVGRFVAFFWDLGAHWWRWARGRLAALAGRDSEPPG